MLPDDVMETVRGYRTLDALVPGGWETGTYQTEDGAELGYARTGGAQPALVLVHGFQAAGITWLRVAQAFEEAFDVIMPDLRGHGRSAGVLAGFGATQMAADIAVLLDVLGVDEAAVLGHSLGADVAAQFAATYPARVRKLVLEDPAMRVYAVPRDAGGARPAWFETILATLRAIKTQSHVDALRSALALLPPGSQVWGEADLVTFAEAYRMLNLDVLDVEPGGLVAVQPEVMARVQCPVLLLTARAMGPGMGASAEGIAAIVETGPGREHVHFEDAGHLIHVDRFERFVEVVRAFLGAES